MLLAPPLSAQGWSGSLALSFLSRSVTGSEDSYRSQINLDEGISLDHLSLDYEGPDASGTMAKIRASGFGGAEPNQSLRLDLHLSRPWEFELDYDRRESFFALTEVGHGLRTDDWRIDRWHIGGAWEGWSKARLQVDFRSYERSGTVERPLFTFNELYPLSIDLDETMEEWTLALETRDLPVHLLFEHSMATYERRNRRRPAGSENLDGGDPDLLVGAAALADEERDVPTTRLVATYGNPRFEVVGSLLWRPAELDGSGPVSNTVAIAGGRIGRVETIDDFVTSAEMDSLVGNLRLGFRLAPDWRLRLEADYRDTTTDATLMGERILRVTNPFGTAFEISGVFDDSTVFDVTDDSQRLTVEWSHGGWTLWGGAFAASRDLRWRLGEEEQGLELTRDSDGFLAGASWSKGRWAGNFEFEHGTFDRFVFRTDPETVDRLSLRLRSDLGGGWQMRLHGRLSEADNPSQVSDLDRTSEAWGGGFTWGSQDGATSFGLDLDSFDLRTETDLVLPGGLPDLSLYDLSLLTLDISGRHRVGRFTIDGSATRIEDSGSTWPVESWVARARLAYEIRAGFEILALGEYWSYDEEMASGDDFDVNRYGLGLEWSFQ